MGANAVVAAIVLAGASLPLRAQTTDVALGIEALARRDIRGAEAAFARGTGASDPSVRSAAHQWRGHIAWKIRGDTIAAVRHLSQALASARDSSMVMLEIARLSGARRRHREAVRTAFEAMSRSLDGERRGLAARTLVSLAVSGAFASGTGSLSDSVDLSVLAVVRDTLRARAGRFPGRTVDAMALMEAGALLGDVRSVHVAWTHYFSLVDSATGASIRAAEPKLQGNQEPETQTGRLLVTLMESRLYVPAVLLLRSARGDTMRPPAWMSDAVRYVRFTRAMQSAAEQHYRGALAGASRNGDINRALAVHGRELWDGLGWSAPRAGPRPDFYPAALQRELATRFGTVLSIEKSGSIEELHLAHRIATHAVSTGSATATVVVLDGVAANGVDAWLLDGAGGRAASVAHDTIFERRTAFTETPFRAWIARNDPQSMPAELLRILRDSTADESRARTDSLGFLPGVAARMFRDGAQRIADSTFAQTVYAALRQSTVVLHEARHIADNRSGHAVSAVEAEFRAKVEEVSRASHPRLAMTAILTPKIGDASAHGQANRRVMLGLNKWIREHGPAIAGYDAAMPALLQLPRLSDAQLREAFGSMKRW
ncbi:MAG: hypothetical protein ABIR92_04675 [Gemmatimonadaceae bacterium]